jgi:hypothetical protein
MIRVDHFLFKLGRVVATPGAVNALRRAGQPAWTFLARHLTGDYGEVGADDRAANDEAVRAGGRILSSYTTTAGEAVWVITEADRSSTALLLPEEY